MSPEGATSRVGDEMSRVEVDMSRVNTVSRRPDCLSTLQHSNIHDTLSPCAPKHVVWQRVFQGASEFKVRNLI